MQHRSVEYEISEDEPGRWQWKIFLNGLTTASVTSDPSFRSFDAAAEACIEEINDGIERSRTFTKPSRI